MLVIYANSIFMQARGEHNEETKRMISDLQKLDEVRFLQLHVLKLVLMLTALIFCQDIDALEKHMKKIAKELQK